MAQSLRVVLGLVMIGAGMATSGYASYLWYASLPEEHTRRQASKRVALFFGGIALLLSGIWLIT